MPWFCNTEGQIEDVADLPLGTFLIEVTGDFTTIHIGCYEAGEPGFRVDESYVLHPDSEEKPEI